MSYTGKWIKVDLSRETYEILDTDRALLEKYIGGKGLGFAILDEIAPSADYFGEENPLIFVNGPFTGTKVQTSARTTLVTRSPLTGSALDTHCGGHFGPQLKAAGYDYMVIVGKATRPVYLYANKGELEFLDASGLTGKGIFETTDMLLEKHPGIDPRVACIGPAGENLSKIACIGVDKHRQYGRGGAGAVMGSKNLKAIVVDGKLKINYHDEEKFEQLNLELAKKILHNPSIKFRRKKGTMLWVRSANELGILPTRNWQDVTFDDYEKISSETAREELKWRDTNCFGCAIRCSKWAHFKGRRIEGPEYETTAFLGSGCMLNSITEITVSNEICNDLGLDTISAGGICGFAMECYEKGLLDDWSGLKLEWGNAEAQQELLRLMAYREGVGAIFADGTRDAAEKIGQGSKDFAINVFGMEMSGVNPKGAFTMGFSMSVADFGSHTRNWQIEQHQEEGFSVEDVPAKVFKGIDEVNVRNSLVVCDFVSEGVDALIPVLNAATGFNHTPESMKALGAEITDMARRYNLRNGRTCDDDIMPERFFKEESLSGLMKGKVVDKELFKALVQEYYKLRGWNEQGEPSLDSPKEDDYCKAS